MKTTSRLPRLLVIRPFREACRDFYAMFKRFDVTYLTVGDKSLEKNNFRVINTTYYPQIGKVSNLSWTFMKDMEKYVKEADIVCIGDNYYFYNLQAVLLAKKYHKKIVTILWATIPRHISSWLPPYSFITKKVIDSTDIFILRDKSAIPFAMSIGAQEQKIKVVYKGIDLSRFYPNRVKSNKTVNILYVGKLVRSKGVFDLIKAFKMLIGDGLDVKLTLAGEGNVGKLSDSRIKVLGFIGYDKLPEIYRQADIFCSPSKEMRLMGVKIWEEYFSYTLMEAQSSGLPIVTTGPIGVREEVGQFNKFVKEGDVLSLYKSLKKLCENEGYRKKIGIANRKRAEKLFDAKVQAGKTEAEILKLC